MVTAESLSAYVISFATGAWLTATLIFSTWPCSHFTAKTSTSQVTAREKHHRHRCSRGIEGFLSSASTRTTCRGFVWWVTSPPRWSTVWAMKHLRRITLGWSAGFKTRRLGNSWLLPHMHHTCDSQQRGVGVDTSLRMRPGLLLDVYIVRCLRMW